MMYDGFASERFSCLHIFRIERKIVHELLNVPCGDLVYLHVAYSGINTFGKLFHTRK